MTASKTSFLSKPVVGIPISAPTLAYFRSRNRRKLHSLVLKEFKESGISQAELCVRLRKDPATISRMLGTPGNWGLDTASDLLFAIRGGEPSYRMEYPLDKPAINHGASAKFETDTKTVTAGNTNFSSIKILTKPKGVELAVNGPKAA